MGFMVSGDFRILFFGLFSESEGGLDILVCGCCWIYMGFGSLAACYW